MYRLLLPLYRVLALIGWLLLFYFCFRISFFILNRDVLPDPEGQLFGLLLKGMRFDLSVILLLNVPFILLSLLPFRPRRSVAYRRILQFVFLIPNGLAFLFEIADWAYYPFNHKRATSEVISLISEKGDFINLLPGFFRDFWYIFLIALVAVVLLLRCYRITSAAFEKREMLARVLGARQPDRPWMGRCCILIVVAGLSVLGIRGGTQLVPINIRNAVMMSEPAHAPILLNTPFSILFSLGSHRLQPKRFMPDEVAEAYVSPIKRYSHSGEFRKKNVVVIVLESFSKEFTGLGPGKSYTPFLDSLMDVGMTFTNAFANGLHSAEGIPAVLAGIPSLMDEYFAVSVYSTNSINAFPSLLRKYGYRSAFYHGGTNGTMSFDVFASSAGFDHYYGREEYGNDADYDQNWGIYDLPFFQYFERGLDTMRAPFFATLFSVTSHPPFPMPEAYRGVFPEGKLAIYPTIGYTDHALRSFFDSAKKESWFSNTLFVITADHCSPLASSSYYATGTGRYQIPLVFYAPGDTALRGYNPVLMQQIDILPSVLDYLRFPDSFFAFGNSMFRPDAPRFVVNALSGVYDWIYDGQQWLIFENQVQHAYTFPEDTLRKNDLTGAPGFKPDTASLHLFQAFVQLYNDALIHNKMTVSSRQKP